MKLLPIPLSPLGAPPPLGLWSSDLLWRYPPAPPSPLADLKTQLPPQLSTDPRLWGREEVGVFLRWSEREFDLPKFDLDLFQMNGKALCVLTKNDLAERCPGAGDVLHNVLQMLVRDSQMMHRHLPSSPITPTSRYPLSPHSHPPTPNWNALAPPDSPFFHSSHLQQFMAASNSVTLSPAPSIDSQAGSPPQSHQEQLQNVFQNAASHKQNSSGGSSNQSDSDEDTNNYHQHLQQLHQQQQENKLFLQHHQQQSPPLTPISKETHNLGQLHLIDTKALQSYSSSLNNINSSNNSNSINNNSNGSNNSSAPSSGSSSAPTTPGAFMPVKREFFPDTPEPNTNGRLLWDFLQQLLNDPAQRYSSYIAWKCRDTGVFKIVDPAGLAQLWGKQKNHLSMNYDKMSRALRYYYRVNILRKVQGERHCYQFLRNPTELKSIKNISLLRQTMANQNASSNQAQNGQLQQQQQQQQQQQNGSSNGSNTNHSIMPLISSVANMHHLAAAAAAAASAAATPTSQTSPQLHHHHQQQQQQHQQQIVQNSRNIKMETDTDDMKPTDLSTNRNAGVNNADCYPLIRNSNGLTTIQLMRQQQQQQQFKNETSSPPSSPSPLSINSQSLHTISNNLHHLQQQQLHQHQQQQQQQQQQQEQNGHPKSDDESMMPTDLSKNDQVYYK